MRMMGAESVAYHQQTVMERGDDHAGETLDDIGGWKAADTNVWRDHLHAATVVGRAAAARVAVELGYAIEPDAGASGRLGHWRIAGIPDELLAVHSKRAAEINAAVGER